MKFQAFWGSFLIFHVAVLRSTRSRSTSLGCDINLGRLEQLRWKLINSDEFKNETRPRPEMYSIDKFLSRYYTDVTGSCPVAVLELFEREDSVGNLIGKFLFEVGCTFFAGAHIIILDRYHKRRSCGREFLYSMPKVLVNNNPASSFEVVVSNWQRTCPNFDREYPWGSVRGNHEEYVPVWRQLLSTALRNQFNSLNVSTSLLAFKSQQPSENSRRSLSDVPDLDQTLSHAEKSLLPQFPTVTLQYRCSDNIFFGSGYGLIPFDRMMRHIPPDAKYIYVVTEGSSHMHRPSARSRGCTKIVHTLRDDIAKAFPRAQVILRSGGRCEDAFVVLSMFANSNVTICSPSTFCFFFAVLNQVGKVYVPTSPVNLGGSLQDKEWDNIYTDSALRAIDEKEYGKSKTALTVDDMLSALRRPYQQSTLCKPENLGALRQLVIDSSEFKNESRPRPDLLSVEKFLGGFYSNVTRDCPVVVLELFGRDKSIGNKMGNFLFEVGCAYFSGAHIIILDRHHEARPCGREFFDAIPKVLANSNPVENRNAVLSNWRKKCPNFHNQYPWGFLRDNREQNIPVWRQLLSSALLHQFYSLNISSAMLLQNEMKVGEPGMVLNAPPGDTRLNERGSVYTRVNNSQGVAAVATKATDVPQLSLVLDASEKQSLPPFPTVTLHYRCSDNIFFGSGYGLIPFDRMMRYIPPDAKYIYVVTEGSNHGLQQSHYHQPCSRIVAALREDIASAFPKAKVVLRSGGLCEDAFVVLSMFANSNVTICSPSTFCYFFAVLNQVGKVFVPLLPVNLTGNVFDHQWNNVYSDSTLRAVEQNEYGKPPEEVSVDDILTVLRRTFVPVG